MILDMSEENDSFDWRWISDRRNSELSLNQVLRNAPFSWKKWVKGGSQISSGLKEKFTNHLLSQ